jgi:putative endonuclease
MAGQRKKGMFYAYILQSLSYPDRLYRGHSSDLKQRLADHNTGRCPHTAKFAPWKLQFFAAFDTLEKAHRFELYLKSGSGHAFTKRQL